MGQNNIEIKVTNIALCFMFLSLKHYDKCYFMFNSLKMFYRVLANNDTNNNQIYYIMKFSYVYLIFMMITLCLLFKVTILCVINYFRCK